MTTEAKPVSVTRTLTRGEAFAIAWYILTHLHRRKFTITVTEADR